MAKRKSITDRVARTAVDALNAFGEGLATGAGVPQGMVARDPAAVAATLFPPEVPIDMGGDQSEFATLLGGPGGQAPEPPPDPIEEARGYISEYKQAPLDMEGKQKVMRLGKLIDAAQDPTLRPSAKAELLTQFQQERDRLRLEDHIQQPPTIESEAQTRVITDEGGMQTILQPDGRIDTKDPTTKAELERLKMLQKDQDSRTHAQELQIQAREQRRAERSKVADEQRKAKQEAEQKASEERAERYRQHYEEALKKKPMSDRYEDARKALESQYKRLNPDRPARRFRPDEIANYAMSRINIDFKAKEKAAHPGDPMASKRKLSPAESLQQRLNEDPEGFREEMEDVRQRLLTDLSRDPDKPITNAEIFQVMVSETPEALQEDLQQFMSTAGRPSTAERGPTTFPPPEPEPDLLDVFADARQPTEADMPMVRSFFKQRQQQQPGQPPVSEDDIASPSDLPPSDLPPADMPADVPTLPPEVAESKPIQEVEKLLTDREGQPVSFANVVDPETLGYFAEQGSKNPIQDAAKAVTKAIRTGAQNINLMPTMERRGAKLAFPLVTDESDKGLDQAGVRPGEIYRDPLGNLKEREAPKGKKAGKAVKQPSMEVRPKILGTRTL